MDFTLSSSYLALQVKARRFADEVLLPYEMECEENDGLSPESLRAINDQVMRWEFNALNHSREDGGQGFSIFEQMLVDEQLGRVTGAIWDTVFRPSFPMKFASPAQKAEYLIPTCQGKRRDCYAITERDAGSDPTLCQTTAVETADGWRLNGEKWFVTVGDWADYILLHAHIDADSEKSAIFFVDKNLPGVKIKRTPKYTHHFCYKHPEFLFDDVIVKSDKMLGKPGQGFDFTKSWFIEARIGIAARCIGAATRALEEANDFASKRVQFGAVIRDFQAIEFMLADMAVEIMAAKTLLYKVCWEIDRGQEVKLNHAKVAAVKLYCSEMAGRVCDRAVQILGGRGYMRENAVERLWRDTRVDRIWEGTSEIQRVIVGRQIRKRGLETYTKW